MKREIQRPYSFPIKNSTAGGFKLPLKPTSKTSSTHQNGNPCMNSPKKSPPGLRTVAGGDPTLQLMRGHKQPVDGHDTLFPIPHRERTGLFRIAINTANKTEREVL